MARSVVELSVIDQCVHSRMCGYSLALAISLLMQQDAIIVKCNSDLRVLKDAEGDSVITTCIQRKYIFFLLNYNVNIIMCKMLIMLIFKCKCKYYTS